MSGIISEKAPTGFDEILTVADILGNFQFILKNYGSQLFRYGFPDYHGTPTNISDNKMISQEIFDILYEANLIEKHRQERGWSLYALNLTKIGGDRKLLRERIQAIINNKYNKYNNYNHFQEEIVSDMMESTRN